MPLLPTTRESSSAGIKTQQSHKEGKKGKKQNHLMDSSSLHHIDSKTRKATWKLVGTCTDLKKMVFLSRTSGGPVTRAKGMLHI